MRYPFKEASGRYRTGLDENAKSVISIPDPELRAQEKQRIIKLRTDLEYATGLDLSPKSSYYNHNSSETYKVSAVALRDQDNVFNLEDPWQHVTWLWVSNLPDVASSLTAYNKGLFPHDTQFYVNNEDIEAEIEFKKKKQLNNAIVRIDAMSIAKRMKIARLCDLPIGDEDKEEKVYNMLDEFLKKKTIPFGVHSGKEPLRIFQGYASLADDILDIRDTIETAFREQIYKIREGGRVYEAELEIFKTKDDLIIFMADPLNQKDYLELSRKINAKKLQHV
jgi:hypothetical protein